MPTVSITPPVNGTDTILGVLPGVVPQAVFIGIVATGFMDLAALGLRRCFGMPSLNYAMVGRWIGHIPKGRLVHRSIGQSAEVRGELVLGWAAHYLIGILFVVVFIGIFGDAEAVAPKPAWPILFGVATIVAPFLVLQPGMGAGLAASRMPSPWLARARSLTAHILFGIGLWLGTCLWLQVT